ncbi:MLP-like protein 43 [Bienertia sinuspersici]
MGIKGKFEVEFDMNCNADILFELFTHRQQILCDISPSDVHGCELHEGEFGKVGSVIKWNFMLDGQQHFGKELTEEIDEEKKLVRFKALEGDILNEFPSLTTMIQMIPKEESVKRDKMDCGVRENA